jgi:hypothetical protein
MRARPGAGRLAGLDVEHSTEAIAVLRDAPAVLLCTLQDEHAAGDHSLWTDGHRHCTDGARPSLPAPVYLMNVDPEVHVRRELALQWRRGARRVLPRRRPSLLFGGGAGRRAHLLSR